MPIEQQRPTVENERVELTWNPILPQQGDLDPVIIQNELESIDSLVAINPGEAWIALEELFRRIVHYGSHGPRSAAATVGPIFVRAKGVGNRVAKSLGATSFYVEVGTSGVNLGLNFDIDR